MPAPTYISTTSSSVTSYTTTHPVTLPTSVVGNHLLLSFTAGGDGGSIIAPTGWTEVVNVDIYFNLKWRVWIRECTGSEGTSVTVTTSLVNRSASQVLRFNNVRVGVAQSTTWNVSLSPWTDYGTNCNPPAVNAAWGTEAVIFVALAWGGGAGPTITGYPSGYSNSSYSVSGVMTASATKGATASSDDPASFTFNASANNRAATIVLRGAAAVTAGAGLASATGTAHQPTVTPPTTRAFPGTANARGTAYFVRTVRNQVPSDLKVEWDLDNDGDFDQSEEDITAYVLNGSVRRGRDYPSQITGRSRPGSMELTLDNTDGRFNYFNASSPLKVAPFSLKTGRLIRVRTTTATVSDPAVLARDRFNTNGALATDETGKSWAAVSGMSSFSVTNKTAVADGVPNVANSFFGRVVDVTVTKYYAQVVLPYKDAKNWLGLIFHYTDANNYAYLYLGDGVILIRQVSGGVASTLTSDGVENRDDMAVGIAVNGTSVIAYVDGQQVLSTTASISSTGRVGPFANWLYQRPPVFSDFWVWNRSRRTQSWDTAPSGILGTMRVTKVVPAVDANGTKTVQVSAQGDLGLLDRPVEPPASTGPDVLQSFGSKAGQLIGTTLAKAGALHPPGPIDVGDLTLGAVGMERASAISMIRKLEATEAGFVYELPEGGIGFARRSARNNSTIITTFSDDTAVLGRRFERFKLRDWQGDTINEVTSEVSGGLSRYDYVSSNNAFTGAGVANHVTFNLPTSANNAAVGDLCIVAIIKTVYTAGVRWITPSGWTALKDPGDGKGKMAVFARSLTSSDLGASTTFYADSGPSGGTWVAMVFICHNWFGAIASGVAISEAVGYGDSTLTKAQAGTIDLPAFFPPWGAKPTLFIALRTGAHTTGAAAVVSAGSDDLAPGGFDSLGSIHYNVTGFGQEVYQAGLQWCRRIRAEAVINPGSFGGTFTGFSYTEGLIIGVRGGFDGEVAPATGGLQVTDRNAADQIDRGGAILAHPDPGTFFEDKTAAHVYNHHILTRFGVDRPIVSLGFTATRDSFHRNYASTVALSDRVRVDADGRTGQGIDAEFFVETITHRFSRGTALWEVDLDLSPASDAGTGADGYIADISATAGKASATGSANQPSVTSTSSGITVVGQADTLYTGSSVTSINVALPGISINANDIIEIAVATQESPTAVQPNTPSGYTLVSDGGSVTAFIPRITIFYKRAAGGESGSVTVSWPSGTPRPYASCVVYRGVNVTTAYDATATQVTSGGANPDPASITTATNNAMVVAHVAGNKTPATASTISSGYTSVSDQDATERAFVQCRILKVTAGAENPGAYTWAVDNSASVTTALRP